MSFFNLNLILNKIPAIILFFLLTDLGLCIAYVVNHSIGQPIWIVTRLLDLNGELSIAAWYSSIQFFCIFIFAAVFSWFKIKGNNKDFALIFLPILFLGMSVDESVQFHEWLGQRSDVLFEGGTREGTSFDKTGIWMFVFGIPILGFFLLWAYTQKQRFSDNPVGLKKLVIGMIIMSIGALGFETLANFVGEDLWLVEVVLEEGFEMVGATIMFWSIYTMTIGYIPELFPSKNLI